MGKVTDAMATFEALLKDRSAAADLRARKHCSMQLGVQVWQPGQRGSQAPHSALCCASLASCFQLACTPADNAIVDALARNGDMPAAERLLERATDLATKQGAWWHASYCWYVLAVIAVRVPAWLILCL